MQISEGVICLKSSVSADSTLLDLYISSYNTQPRPVIEAFGGKRALGFLLKSELCQKRSKFRMQFCLRVSNNVLHVFPLNFASFFEIIRMQKKNSICCDVST